VISPWLVWPAIVVAAIALAIYAAGHQD